MKNYVKSMMISNGSEKGRNKDYGKENRNDYHHEKETQNEDRADRQKREKEHDWEKHRDHDRSDYRRNDYDNRYVNRDEDERYPRDYDESDWRYNRGPDYGYYDDKGRGRKYDGERYNILGRVGYDQSHDAYTVNGYVGRGDENHHHQHMDKFTKERAEKIVKSMENEDGTKGEHWNFDQTKQVMESKSIKCDPIEFYVAMNMIYSDYYQVAKKLGVNSVDFYADMAKAFLDDKDSGEYKLEKYFECVVQ